MQTEADCVTASSPRWPLAILSCGLERRHLIPGPRALPAPGRAVKERRRWSSPEEARHPPRPGDALGWDL